LGRPPIGKKRMTRTEYQRRWRKRRRQGQVRSRSKPEPSPSADFASIERLTWERDRAVRERDHALRELGSPRTVVAGDTGRCYFCRRFGGDVAADGGILFMYVRKHFTLFLCTGCIAELGQRANEQLARSRRDGPPPGPEIGMSDTPTR
jgi:hypothetical protein